MTPIPKAASYLALTVFMACGSEFGAMIDERRTLTFIVK